MKKKSESQKVKPLTLHYSGKHSKEFWRRVNTYTGPPYVNLYTLGLALQNLEEVVLALLSGEQHRGVGEGKDYET